MVYGRLWWSPIFSIMLINVRYDNSIGFVCDENAATLISEFREVLKDKELGTLAMCYVALSIDPASFLATVYEDEEDRRKEAAKSVYEDKLPKGINANAKIMTACRKYRKLCNTPEIKMRQQFQGAMVNVGKYIETTAQKLDDENVKDFMTTLKEFSPMIDKYSDMNKGKESELDEKKSIVRGERQLTHRERKKQKKT